jgi:hypothetical protein
MDQIIQIKIEVDQPKPSETLALTEQTPITDLNTTAALIAPVAQQQKTTTSRATTAQPENSSAQPVSKIVHSGNYRTFTKFPKPKNRRFKKVKRKHNKRKKSGKKSGCYKF